MSKEIEVSKITWRGIKITINYKPKYRKPIYGYKIVHLEVITENKTPLPFTETGYHSHFTDPAEIEAYGSPVDYVKAWLEEAAKSRAWKEQEVKRVS